MTAHPYTPPEVPYYNQPAPMRYLQNRGRVTGLVHHPGQMACARRDDERTLTTMTEASDKAGIVFADEWNRGNPARRCVAKSSRTGKRCRKWAIRGGTTCPTHGGSTAHVKRKARERIERAADRLAMELLGIATSAESEAVRLAATKDALDRAGLSAKTQVEVDVGIRPFEKVFDGIAPISRAESRRRRGLPDMPALDPATAEIVDAEVVEMPRAGAERLAAPTARSAEGDGRTGTRRPPPWTGEPMPAPQRRPSVELVTLEEAAEDMARDRSRTRRG